MAALHTVSRVAVGTGRYIGLGLGLCAGILPAATVSVTDNVSTFSTLESFSGGILSDFTYDQQTGQGADDFVGDGTGGYYGFYYKYGQIGGVDSMVFRVRLNVLDTNQGVPKFTGNIRIGVDGDGDGNVDLYLGVSTGSGQTPEIVFQNPTGTGATANTSPSTSALGTSYGTIATSTSNFNYSQVTDGSMFGTGNNLTPGTDAFLTFALSFSTFKTYLESQMTGVTITVDSLVRFLAFSSTQGNAVNQDTYGLGNTSVKANADTRFDQGGGFTNYYSASGKVIPEASTVTQAVAFVLSGLGVVWLRRKRSAGSRAA